jgi:hypothetical protein
VRTSHLLAVALPIAIAAVSCGRSDRVAANGDVDLQRDLKLAATTTMDLAGPKVNPANFDKLETAPETAPQRSKHLEKGAGSKAIASRTPDLKAIQLPQVAATDNVPQTQTVALAPSPIPTTDPVATVPQATRVPQTTGATGAGTNGGVDRGGVFGGMGPVIGVVIRGGGVDGDHCEPHGRGGAPGVYLPPPGGIGTVTRFPAFPRGGVHR